MAVAVRHVVRRDLATDEVGGPGIEPYIGEASEIRKRTDGAGGVPPDLERAPEPEEAWARRDGSALRAIFR